MRRQGSSCPVASRTRRTTSSRRSSRARAPRSARSRRATQEAVDEVVTAAGWAIVEPEHNRALAELAVRDTGLGNVADKIAKNRRKTMGLLRDLARREIGRRDRRGPTTAGSSRSRGPSAWSAAITPSTNPAATPANNIINALKGRNAIIVAPSPKGASTLALLARITFMPSSTASARRATWCSSCPRR